jgi:hypothetical protein
MEEPERTVDGAAGWAEPAAGVSPRPGAGEPGAAPVAEPAVVGTGHPAVDEVLHAIANAADLPPADQIAQYEAAHHTLQETLATIDEG